MIVGTITGRVWCTSQRPELQGARLAIVTERTKSAPGRELVAADLVGAGDGETVLVVTGGAAARLASADVDAAIVGIIDSVEYTSS